MPKQTDTQAILTERFKELPKVVQNAITSADVTKQLRQLADTNKLHIDQWETLENEVMMTLFGVTPFDELQANIEKHVGVSNEMARELTVNISKIVFQPIREELERELEHPDAKAAEVSGVEAARTEALGDEAALVLPPAPVVAPATPPAESPTQKVERAPASPAYKAEQASSSRKDVVDDPYREQPA